jgi:hypothetical protein
MAREEELIDAIEEGDMSQFFRLIYPYMSDEHISLLQAQRRLALAKILIKYEFDLRAALDINDDIDRSVRDDRMSGESYLNKFSCEFHNAVAAGRNGRPRYMQLYWHRIYPRNYRGSKRSNEWVKWGSPLKPDQKIRVKTTKGFIWSVREVRPRGSGYEGPLGETGYRTVLREAVLNANAKPKIIKVKMLEDGVVTGDITVSDDADPDATLVSSPSLLSPFFLEAASFNGHLEIVKLLIAIGADANEIIKLSESEKSLSIKHTTVLNSAVEQNHVAIVEYLIDEVDIIDENDRGIDDELFWQGKCENPLIIAFKKGHRSIVESLIRAGANINVQEKEDYSTEPMGTPLYYAVLHGYDDIAVDLIRAGAEINVEIYNPPRKKKPPDTALKIAIKQNNINIVKTLIERGADIKLVSHYYGVIEDSALSIAIDKNVNPEIVRYLIEAVKEKKEKWYVHSEKKRISHMEYLTRMREEAKKGVKYRVVSEYTEEEKNQYAIIDEFKSAGILTPLDKIQRCFSQDPTTQYEELEPEPEDEEGYECEYECEYNCGFVGSFDVVQAHESECPGANAEQAAPTEDSAMDLVRAAQEVRLAKMAQLKNTKTRRKTRKRKTRKRKTRKRKTRKRKYKRKTKKNKK